MGHWLDPSVSRSDRWRELVNVLMDIRVLWKTGNFVTSLETVSFYRRFCSMELVSQIVSIWVIKYWRRYSNYFSEFVFTIRSFVYLFELTLLYPDGVECIQLTLLASRSLQLYELAQLPAGFEAWYVAVWYPIWPRLAYRTDCKPQRSER